MKSIYPIFQSRKRSISEIYHRKSYNNNDSLFLFKFLSLIFKITLFLYFNHTISLQNIIEEIKYMKWN